MMFREPETIKAARYVAAAAPGTWRFVTAFNGQTFTDGTRVYEVIAAVEAQKPFPTGYALQMWGIDRERGGIRRALCDQRGTVLEVVP